MNFPERSSSGACGVHPEREAIGICVRCRLVFCSECITKIDGINHCKTCLAAFQTPLDSTPQTTDVQTPSLLQPFFAYLIALCLFALMIAALFLLSLTPALLQKLSEGF